MPQVDVQWPSDDDNDEKATGNESQHAENEVKNSASEQSDKFNHDQKASDESKFDSALSSTHFVNKKDETVKEDSMSKDAPENTATDKPNKGSVKSTSKVFGKYPKSNLRLAGEVIVILVVVGLGIWCWNLYNDRKDLQAQVAHLNVNPQTAVQKQTQILVTQVAKLMQLPSNETPTIVEVSNATQAKKQSAFFQNSQNGDKALLYIKAGEAILYRPSTNKIIVVAPITYNSASSTSSPKN